jgi:RHS repeat-associated protein
MSNHAFSSRFFLALARKLARSSAIGSALSLLALASSGCLNGFSIDIQSPRLGSRTTDDSITVSGRINVDSRIDLSKVRITVEGVPATLNAVSKTFSAQPVPLRLGANLITARMEYEDAAPPSNARNAQDNRDAKKYAHLNQSRDARRIKLTASDFVIVYRNGLTLPPNPVDVAPPLATHTVTQMRDAVSFLYTGANPIQTGVAPGTIDPLRVSVLRGRAINRAGEPVPGAQVTVLGHPELGQTLTRADGEFDLAVNGGSRFTVNLTRSQYLPVSRTLDVSVTSFAQVEEVVLTQLDPVVTTVSFSNPASAQVATSSPITDVDGTRTGTLVFPPGIQAEIVLPDGTRRPASSLNIRATEYTVGPNGPKAMPATLPQTSAYTYAVELSADEAIAAGSDSVVFDRPLYYYVDNFLGFPVGSAVPYGYFDRKAGVWKAEPNGTVVRVLTVAGGTATVDVNGQGQAATPQELASLGFTPAELGRVASLYTAGKSLWRVPVRHFSPADFNWPILDYPVTDNRPTSTPRNPKGDKVPRKQNKCGGSVIEVQSQTLGETIEIAGTAYTLNYRSNRVSGRDSSRTIEIPLLDSRSIPPGLASVKVTVDVAGKSERFVLEPTPGLRLSHTWDGRDIYGRTVVGAQKARVSVIYAYDTEYVSVLSRFYMAFGRIPSSIEAGVRARSGLTQDFVKVFSFDLESNWDARAQGLGGWTLSEHHAYDPTGRTLLLGTGETRQANSMTAVIETIAGNGTTDDSPDGTLATEAGLNIVSSIAAAPDGTIYFIDRSHHKIKKIALDGRIYTVAGNGTPGSGGDGGPATQAQIYGAWDLIVSRDGSLIFSDALNFKVRRVTPDGIIHTIAGTGQNLSAGDGGLATQASLTLVAGIAELSGGDLIVMTQDRIRQINTNGVISTVLDKSYAELGLGLPSQDVAVTDRDELIFTAEGAGRIYRLRKDGVIEAIAGNGFATDRGLYEGIPALETQMGPNVWGFLPLKDGSLLYTDTVNHVIRKIEPQGIINTYAGSSRAPGSHSGDKGPAARSTFVYPHALALLPTGELLVSDSAAHRIRKISPAFPGAAITNIIVASEDGTETYLFDQTGRHLETRNAITGLAKLRFSYSASGYLTGVTDRHGNVTTIERSSSGEPLAIVSPYGKRTELFANANGYLERVQHPSGTSHQLVYRDAGGLLSSFRDPKGGVYEFTYDTLGRLIGDRDAVGALKTLVQNPDSIGIDLTFTTPEGRQSRFRGQTDAILSDIRDLVSTDGTASRLTIGKDDTELHEDADGSKRQEVRGADPQHGMQAPVIVQENQEQPSGLIKTFFRDRQIQRFPGSPRPVDFMSESITTNGRRFETQFNVASRTISQSTPEGRSVTTTLDALDRVNQVRSGSLSPVQYAYDSRGRISTLAQGGRTTSYAYGADGLLSSVTNPLNQTTSYGRDELGRITSQTLQDGRQIRFNFDENGNLTSVTPPGRPVHTQSYNLVNLLMSYLPPAVTGSGSNSTAYAYNLDRQLTRVTRPDGRVIEYFYEPTSGKLTEIRTAEGSTLYTYSSTSGRLRTARSADDVLLTFSYDGSLPIQVASSGAALGTMNYYYDNDFRLSYEGGSGVFASFLYDGDGLLNNLVGVPITRDPVNGLVTGHNSGGLNEVFTYNSFGELISQSVTGLAGELFSHVLTRDGLGRITQRAESIGGASSVQGFTYDASGRLTDVSRDSAPYSHYEFDSNSNRVAASVAGGAPVSATYDAQDRMLTYGNAEFTYTENGELRTKTVNGPSGVETTRYGHDSFGNLKSVELPTGARIEYVLDALNRRVSKKVNGVFAQGFIYRDALAPFAEVDSSGTIRAAYFYGTKQNSPDYIYQGGVYHRVISDHLGSVRLVINMNTGAISQRIDYDEFGVVLADTNPGFQPFGFAGGLYDQHTKLLHFGAREYDAATGRWTSKDPVRFDGQDVNLYGYVYNNPLAYTDSSGLTLDQFSACIKANAQSIVDDTTHVAQRAVREVTALIERANQAKGAVNSCKATAAVAGGVIVQSATVAVAAATNTAVYGGGGTAYCVKFLR